MVKYALNQSSDVFWKKYYDYIWLKILNVMYLKFLNIIKILGKNKMRVNLIINFSFDFYLIEIINK